MGTARRAPTFDYFLPIFGSVPENNLCRLVRCVQIINIVMTAIATAYIGSVNSHAYNGANTNATGDANEE
jgi:hypothetical protein